MVNYYHCCDEFDGKSLSLKGVNVVGKYYCLYCTLCGNLYNRNPDFSGRTYARIQNCLGKIASEDPKATWIKYQNKYYYVCRDCFDIYELMPILLEQEITNPTIKPVVEASEGE